MRFATIFYLCNLGREISRSLIISLAKTLRTSKLSGTFGIYFKMTYELMEIDVCFADI